MAKKKKEENNIKCPICNEKHPSPGFGLVGEHNGNGGTLGGNIMQGCYGGGSAENHKFSVKDYFCAQAHHLICCESMRNDKKWAKICKAFGYDIDCCENGVFLPGDMRIACQLKIPLHSGHHGLTKIYPTSTAYVAAVIKKIDKIKQQALEEDACKNLNLDIIPKLNNISKEIWVLVEGFKWFITKNGNHFKGGNKIGCSNELYISDLIHKKHYDKNDKLLWVEITNARNCLIKRKHKIDVSKSGCFKERKGTANCEVVCNKKKIKT